MATHTSLAATRLKTLASLSKTVMHLECAKLSPMHVIAQLRCKKTAHKQLFSLTIFSHKSQINGQ